MAAVLACGPDALLSRHAAAALWELRPAPQSSIDVTAPTTRRHPGIRCHRSAVPAAQRTLRDGIPVTIVERTLLDYAEIAARRQLTAALGAAQRALPGRRGLGPVRAVLATLEDEAPWLSSEGERALRELIVEHGLPVPRFNVLVAGELVDAVWDGTRLVVEVDSWRFHRSRGAFERDRRRDTALALAGHRVVRLTYQRLIGEPAAVADTLRRPIGSAPP